MRRNTALLLCSVLAIPLLAGCAATSRFDAETRGRCYDAAWGAMKNDWAYFEMRDELTGARERFRAPAVSARTRREYLIALARMLAWFADPHIQFVNLREYWTARENQPLILLVDGLYMAAGRYWVALDSRQIVSLRMVGETATAEPAEGVLAELPAALPEQALYQLTHVEGVGPSLLALQLLLAEPNQVIQLGVRLADGRLADMEIVRAPRDAPPRIAATQPVRPRRGEPALVRARQLDGNIAYVSVSSLDDPSVVELTDAAVDRALSSEGLILDLRTNSGGQLRIGAKVLGRFLTETRPYAVLQVRSRWWLPGGDVTTSRSWVRTAAPRGQPFTKPLAVLIDSMTASFGEVLAFALHDTCGAMLVGAPTLGAGAGLAETTLPDGLRFQFSKFPVRRLDGRAYQGEGIEPDLPVPLDPAEVERDGPAAIVRWRQRVLETAVEALRNRIAHQAEN